MVILRCGKQNHQCLLGGTQFVMRNETVSAQTKELMVLLLLERISLRGICLCCTSFTRLVIKFYWGTLQRRSRGFEFLCSRRCRDWNLVSGSRWIRSFVGKKENKRWIWLIIERRTRQIIAIKHRRPEQGECRCFMGTSAFGSKSQSLSFDW